MQQTVHFYLFQFSFNFLNGSFIFGTFLFLNIFFCLLYLMVFLSPDILRNNKKYQNNFFCTSQMKWITKKKNILSKFIFWYVFLIFWCSINILSVLLINNNKKNSIVSIIFMTKVLQFYFFLDPGAELGRFFW